MHYRAWGFVLPEFPNGRIIVDHVELVGDKISLLQDNVGGQVSYDRITRIRVVAPAEIVYRILGSEPLQIWPESLHCGKPIYRPQKLVFIGYKLFDALPILDNVRSYLFIFDNQIVCARKLESYSLCPQEVQTRMFIQACFFALDEQNCIGVLIDIEIIRRVDQRRTMPVCLDADCVTQRAFAQLRQDYGQTRHRFWSPF